MERGDDERFMARALELAERGLGETNPNPLVGCVLVRGGRIVGEGFHARAGGAHAEVVALEQAGGRARGAHAYVTLEPCAHHGRTPPCAPRLVEAGVARVVAALRDPNPRVSGRGLRLLRRAGIAVQVGTRADQAGQLNERFLIAARGQRPFVLLKVAMTLDGRIATSTGDSKWITAPRQRHAARALRRLHDGVLVGIGTVLADDPRLLPAPSLRRPFHRIVLDSNLRLPPSSRLARSVAEGPVWVLCRQAPAARVRALEQHGVRVLSQATDERELGLAARRWRTRPGEARVSPQWALDALWRQGLWSVMVEGGAEVLGSFLAARLVDQVALFRGPLLLGGARSRPAFAGPDPARLGQALRLSRVGPFGPSPVARHIGAQDDPLFDVWYPLLKQGGR